MFSFFIVCAHSTTAECKREKPLYVKQTLVQHLQGLFLEFIFSSDQILMLSLKGYFKALFSPLIALYDPETQSHGLFFSLTIPLTNKHKYAQTVRGEGASEKILRLWRCAFVFRRPLPLSVHSLASRSLGIFMRLHSLLMKLVGMLYRRGKLLNIKWKLRSKYQGTSKKQVTNCF